MLKRSGVPAPRAHGDVRGCNPVATDIFNRRTSYHAVRKNPDEKKDFRDLIKAGRIYIIRHVKILAEANPYDPVWTDLFYHSETSKQR